MKKHVSIVIPAFNEEEVITELFLQLKKIIASLSSYVFEIIVVENCSYDKTLDLLLKERKKDKRIKIIRLAKNVGCDGAIIAGLHFTSGDAAVVMMADLQDPPEIIPAFLEKWEKGYDVVYAVIKKRITMHPLRKLGTHIFYKTLSRLTQNLIPENVSDFRLIDKKVYKTIISMPEHNKFFRGLVSLIGFKQIGIPISRPKRFAGKSKAHVRYVFSLAIKSILTFSNAPLRLSWFLALFFTLIGLRYIMKGNTTIGLIELTAALLFGMFGIVSEYIITILEEVRNRPQFSVKETYGVGEK
jgi:dolichol-phosphate mannosyltransferase